MSKARDKQTSKFCTALNKVLEGYVASQIAIRKRIEGRDIRSVPRYHMEGNIYERRYGGMLFIGRLGNRALSKGVSLFFELAPEMQARITRNEVREVLGWIIARWIRRKRRGISLLDAELIRQQALRYIYRHMLSDNEHLLPCVLTPAAGIKNFSIGPVSFRSMKNFLNTYQRNLSETKHRIEKQWIAAARARKDNGRPLCRSMPEKKWPLPAIRAEASEWVDNLIVLIKQYPWMATVRVAQCSPKMSLENANTSLEIALNGIRLYFGADYADVVRQVGKNRIERETAHAALDSKGHLLISYSKRFEGNAVPDDWPKRLSSDYITQLIGSLIPNVTGGDMLPPLHRRIVDALAWYGEAVMDEQPHSRMIKALTGLERIAVTKGAGSSAEMLKR